MPRSKSSKIHRLRKRSRSKVRQIRAGQPPTPLSLPMVPFQYERVIFPPHLTLPKQKDIPISYTMPEMVSERPGKRRVKRKQFTDFIR